MMLLPGDLVLVKGDGLVSEVIEDITHSPYSHVAGVWNGSKLIEAQGFRKTGYVDVGEYAGCADVFRCDQVTYVKAFDVAAYVKRKIGTHYNYFLLGWEFLRYVFHVVLPFAEGDKRICSTLWAEAYKEVAGIDLCPDIRYPSPGDIANSPYLRKVGSL